MKVDMYSLDDQNASINVVARWFQHTWWHANKLSEPIDVVFHCCNGPMNPRFRAAVKQAAKSIGADVTIEEHDCAPLFARDVHSKLPKSMYSGVVFVRHTDGNFSSICSLTGCEYVNLSLC